MSKLLNKYTKTFSFIVSFFIFSSNSYACPEIGGLVDHNCDGRLVILCFGDSITRGVGDSFDLGYPGWLNILAPGAEVINAGVSGERTPTGRTRAPGVFASTTADYTVILQGVNDYWLDTSARSTRNNLLDMKEFASREGSIPLLGSLTSVRRDFQIGWVRSVNSQIGGSVDVDFFSLGNSIISGDQLHPDTFGYQQMANLLFTKLVSTGNTVRPLDLDNDGIYDFAEAGFGSNPSLADTDGDGLLDGDEIFNHGSSPLSADTDGDGLSDFREVTEIGSNPASAKPTPPVILEYEVLEREVL